MTYLLNVYNIYVSFTAGSLQFFFSLIKKEYHNSCWCLKKSLYRIILYMLHKKMLIA